MSANHGRRLAAMTSDSGKKDDFNAAVREASRRRRKKAALAGPLGARDSARVTPRFSRAIHDAPLERRAPSEHVPSKRERLDTRSEATLEEVQREEWLDQTKPDPNPQPPRPQPGFEPWDLIIPSYAREPEQGE